VSIEIAGSLGSLRDCKPALLFRLAMSETGGVGACFVLPSLGSFADHSKIDQFSHYPISAFDGNWIHGCSSRKSDPLCSPIFTLVD
jgi:hypothetical protein